MTTELMEHLACQCGARDPPTATEWSRQCLAAHLDPRSGLWCDQRVAFPVLVWVVTEG